MAQWIEVYGKKRNDSSRLLKKQVDHMAYMFQGICQGFTSDFVQNLLEENGNKKLFRHIDAESGMRYQIEVDYRKGFVTILSVDADYQMIKKAA